MKNSSPAYLMYPADILSSGRVNALKPLEELWYRRAIDLGWENEGMPSDPAEFAGWVGRGCTANAAAKLIEKFYTPHKKDPAKAVNERQEKERKLFLKKRKQKSDAGKKGMAKRWEQKGSGDNTVITEDNIPIPISIPKEKKKEEEERQPQNPVSGNPAVVMYEEVFGPVGATFAKQIASTVTNLTVWQKLVRDKSSFADDPNQRKGVPRWIFQAYDERINERKEQRLPSPAEKLAEIEAHRHEGNPPPSKPFLSGVHIAGPNDPTIG